MNLDKDREFLTRGGVFTNDMIDAYIALKIRGGAALPHDHASGRVRHVLLGLTRGAVAGRGAARPPLFISRRRSAACVRRRAKPQAMGHFRLDPLILLLFP